MINENWRWRLKITQVRNCITRHWYSLVFKIIYRLVTHRMFYLKFKLNWWWGSRHFHGMILLRIAFVERLSLSYELKNYLYFTFRETTINYRYRLRIKKRKSKRVEMFSIVWTCIEFEIWKSQETWTALADSEKKKKKTLYDAGEQKYGNNKMALRVIETPGFRYIFILDK